jgi:hypothetical protein
MAKPLLAGGLYQYPLITFRQCFSIVLVHDCDMSQKHNFGHVQIIKPPTLPKQQPFLGVGGN